MYILLVYIHIHGVCLTTITLSAQFEQDVPLMEGYDLCRVTGPQFFGVFCTTIPATLRHSKSSYDFFKDLHFYNKSSIGACQEAKWVKFQLKFHLTFVKFLYIRRIYFSCFSILKLSTHRNYEQTDDVSHCFSWQ